MPAENEPRTCLITGAARGIGAATAKALARDGWRIIINYRSSKAAEDQVAAEITQAGGQATVIASDITHPADVKRMADELRQNGILLDCLIHNAAAPFLRGSTYRQNWETAFLPQITTSCASFLSCMQEFHSVMSSQCLVLPLLTTALTIHDGADTAAYLAGKGALLGLCRGWYRELSAKGRRMILISPAATKTDLLLRSGGSHPRQMELLEQTLDQAGIATPAEIATQIAKVVANATAILNTPGQQPPHLTVDKHGITRLEITSVELSL